jgi:hypothetical protein
VRWAALVAAAFVACAWLPQKAEPPWNQRLGFLLKSADPDVWDLTHELHLTWWSESERFDSPKIHLPSRNPTWGELNDALRVARVRFDYQHMQISDARPEPTNGGIIWAERPDDPAAFIRWL